MALCRCEKNIEYENNNIGYDEQYTKEDGGGIKCKNYEICDSVLPKWWFECKGNYICTNCDILFSKILIIIDNVDCPICLEKKRSVTLPNCNHTMCIDCFKRSYYGDKDYENEPVFPYPQQEDEYMEDELNPKWENDYPLIKIYNEEWNKWDDDRQIKYDNEENLRKCPICRV
jgi:hypothetical protein